MNRFRGSDPGFLQCRKPIIRCRFIANATPDPLLDIQSRLIIPSIVGKAASDTEEILLDSLRDAESTPFFPKAARPNQRYSTVSYAGLWSESETAGRVWPKPYPDEDGA